MAVALYRKYRPLCFGDVISQKSVVETLKNQLAHDRVSHAYIFTGIRGTGKTTLARILAKAVNCENPKGSEPCCECEICRGIDAGTLLDVSEIDAASNTGVDDIRELRDESVFRPVMCKKRVFIIDEVHMLSASAWGALLKIMEEPPAHVMFILATTEIHKVPATILSRCQRFDLKRLEPEEISAGILEIAKNENVSLEPAAAALIARLADGAMRDALSILDTCIARGEAITARAVAELAGVTDDESLFKAADSLRDNDAAGLLATVGGLYKNSVDPARFAQSLVRHFRCLMLAKLDPAVLADELSADTAARYAAACGDFSQQRIFRIIKTLNEAVEASPKSGDRRLVLEVALMSLCTESSTQRAEPPTPAVSKAPAPQKTPEPVKPAAKPAVAQEPVKPAARPVVAQEPVPTPEPPKTAPVNNPAPPVPNGEVERFADWIKVIAKLRTAAPLLFAVLDGSSAYTDGKQLLVCAGERFAATVRASASQWDVLRRIVEQTTGCTLPLGIYKPDQQ